MLYILLFTLAKAWARCLCCNTAHLSIIGIRCTEKPAWPPWSAALFDTFVVLQLSLNEFSLLTSLALSHGHLSSEVLICV